MKDIHPIFDQLVSKSYQEKLLEQQGQVLWMYGPSGTGKSSIASALQRKLYDEGKFVIVLDGDNLRSGLNAGLGFSKEDRFENIRRASELSKLLKDNGVIVLACFVCPLISMREMAKEIVGHDMKEIYIKTSLHTLKERDTKGLYKKAMEGQMENLTGINAEFEEPANVDLTIDTERLSIDQSVSQVYDLII